MFLRHGDLQARWMLNATSAQVEARPMSPCGGATDFFSLKLRRYPGFPVAERRPAEFGWNGSYPQRYFCMLRGVCASAQIQPLQEEMLAWLVFFQRTITEARRVQGYLMVLSRNPRHGPERGTCYDPLWRRHRHQGSIGSSHSTEVAGMRSIST